MLVHTGARARRRPIAAVSVTALVALALVAAPSTASADEVAPDPSTQAPAALEDSGLHELPTTQAPADAAPDHVLVRFVDGVATRERGSALAAAGVAGQDRVGATGFVEVATDGKVPADVVADLADDDRIADVQLDHVRTASAWTDDPLLDYTWPYLDTVRLPHAWDVAQGTGAVIAVLDTGVAATHEDLVGRVLPGRDFVNGDTDASDDHGHGTMVAGVAAAHGNNGIGIVGAAWDARVLPVKVLGSAGTGSDSAVASGVTWAADQGADVINLSLAGPDPSPVLLAALQYAVAHGSVVVVAAGNAGTEAAQYPAAYAAQVPGVLTVTATDDQGALADLSSWGDATSVAAPGIEVVGPWYQGGYAYGSGTSLAAPLVSGVAAMLAAQNPGWSPAQVGERVQATGRDAGPRGVDPFYGRGVLDAGAALGTRPGIPFDRAVGDDAANDDVPADARPIGLGTAEGTIGAEGDVDWYRFEPGAAAVYQVTVGSVRAGLVVEVRDDSGRLLGAGRPLAAGTTTETHVLFAGAGPFVLGVRAADGSASSAVYDVEVVRAADPAPADTVRFGDRVLLSPDQAFGTPNEVQLRDVTDDGVADLVMTTGEFRAVPGGSTITTALGLAVGREDGRFERLTKLTVYPWFGGSGLTVTDLDADGVTDVVLATDGGLWRITAVGGVLVSHGLLGPAVAYGDVAPSDVDADGDLDLVAAQGDSVQVLRNDGASALVATALPLAAPGSVASVDVDRDGRLDVLTSGGRWFAQQPDGSFVAGAVLDPLADTGRFVVGDTDGDGGADVVAVSASEPTTVLVARADVTSGFVEPIAVAATGGWPVALDDITGDARPDLVTGTRDWAVAVQAPDGTFGGAQTIADTNPADTRWGALPRDADADGDTDLLTLTGGGVAYAPQIPAQDPPGPAVWVWGVTPARHGTGVGVRPTVTVTLARTLAAGAVTGSTVRLRDGLSGVSVPAVRAYDAASGVLSLTPSQDLVPGRHYELLLSGLVDSDGQAQGESFRSWFTVGASGERFSPVEPVRVLDTRSGVGAVGPVAPWEPIDLQLAGVAVPKGATAVVLNVTAVAPTAAGNVRVFPTPASGDGVPLVSNLNVVAGVNQPNLVTVKLGAGSVRLVTDGMSAHLLADLAGYYTQGGATGFVPVSPVRLMDTRNGTGVEQRRVGVGRWVDLRVTGPVPADASAVVLNVTAVRPTGSTNVRVYPAPAPGESQSPPTVSNLNVVAGRDQPNLVTVAIGDGGRVRFYTQTAELDLVADLAGYYSPTGAYGFVALEPTRIADTRDGTGLLSGPLGVGATANLSVTGVAGVPADAAAVVLNVTAVAPQAMTNVRVFPTDPAGIVPHVSNLNVVAGRTEANLVIVRVGDSGRVSFYTQTAALHAVVDVAGYFAP